MSAAILAYGALSSFGRGADAIFTGEVGDAARIETKPDPELAASKLARPFCARAFVDGSAEGGTSQTQTAPDGEDRATLILAAVMADVSAALDARAPGWRKKRVGLALATSSGGMRQAEALFRGLRAGEPIPQSLGETATYFAPLRVIPERFAPATLVLTACSASTLAIGLAMGWLARGACDLVLTGGFDAVSVFVASGFETLRATTSRLPSRPFCTDRDGMALGEGGALLALVRDDDPLARGDVFGWVEGFGASGDAVHVTAPDRTGAGLARAAKAALACGHRETLAADIALVSAHGTATPFNDAAEWKAIVETLGARATEVPVHPFKAQIGHTLGAAGALESLAALDSLRRGVVPASVVVPPRDPEAPAHLLEQTAPSKGTTVLKLSAAFGGANASLVLSTNKPPAARRVAHRVFASRAAHVTKVPTVEEASALTGASLERLARADELVLLALAAIAKLAGEGVNVSGAGVCVGHAYATVDVNDRYFQRVLEKADARMAEPRRFPYTSPNAVAGECSVAFGLTGPNLAVGSGLHGGLEALLVGADLVASGDADRMVVVAVDAPRRAARAIAASCGWPVPEDGAVAVLLSREPVGREIKSWESATSGAPADMPCKPGHHALLGDADTLASASPWGAFAKLSFAP